MLHLARRLGLLLRLALAPLLFAFLSLPAFAGEAEDKAALDQLFAQLLVAPDAETAEQIDQRIWAYWINPTDPILAGRMRDIMSARSMGDPLGAIKLLDQLVTDYPDYAEGWNQRATMYYAVGNYEQSIADCARVLELEPRHFGALSGRGMIYQRQKNYTAALEAFRSVLAISPKMPSAQDAVKALEKIEQGI